MRVRVQLRGQEVSHLFEGPDLVFEVEHDLVGGPLGRLAEHLGHGPVFQFCPFYQKDKANDENDGSENNTEKFDGTITEEPLSGIDFDNKWKWRRSIIFVITSQFYNIFKITYNSSGRWKLSLLEI